MSVDEARQPESMADEFEHAAPPDASQDAAKQQHDSVAADTNSVADSALDPESEPDWALEDNAEALDAYAIDPDVDPDADSDSEVDAGLEADVAASGSEDNATDLENSAEVAADDPNSETVDISNTSTTLSSDVSFSDDGGADLSDTVNNFAVNNFDEDEFDEDEIVEAVSDDAADSELLEVSTTSTTEAANPELANISTIPATEAEEGVTDASATPEAFDTVDELLTESSPTLAESEAEDITDASATTPQSATKPREPLDTAEQGSGSESESETVAAPPITPSIPVQILETVQAILGIVLPILRVAIVLTLKLTIRVLQLVVDLLDEPKSEPAAANQSSSNPSQSPISATGATRAQDLAWNQESRTGAIAYSMADITNGDLDDESEVKRVRFTIDDIYQDDGSLRPLPERLKEIWQDLIRVMRSPLPTALNQQIPDKVFSFILASVLAIVVWNLAAFILPSRPAPRAPQVAQPQPTEVAKPAAPTAPTVTGEPAANPANETDSTQSTPAPEIVPSPAPAPTVQPTPAPTATPQLELEPQDTLIEAIQEQVSEVTQRYADNLIQSVQANFRDGRLTVRVSDDWYRLDASQQDRVATDLLKRAKTLDFGKLELVDSQDNRVARSPVVGDTMLILQRDRTDVTGPVGTTATDAAVKTEVTKTKAINPLESTATGDAIPLASPDDA